MKTYIIDNGGRYSDHAIYFVETAASEDLMECLLELLRPPRGLTGRGPLTISAVAEAPLVWRKGGSMTPKELAESEGDLRYGEPFPLLLQACLAEMSNMEFRSTVTEEQP